MGCLICWGIIKDKSFGLDLSSSTTSLNRKNDTTYTKTKTLATIGQGTVTLTGTDAASNNALKQTNRDITKVDKDIYHVERTQGNIDVTLDNRLLTEDGHKSIAEDIKRNEFLVKSVADVATKDAFQAQNTLDHIDEVQKDLTVQKQMALLEDGKYIRALGDGTPEQKQAALNQYAKIYADTYGISIEQARVIATNKYLKGATHNQRGNNNIYINDNAQKNATDYAHTMGHEVTHARINQGVARDRGSHRLNEQYADTMGEYSADGMEFSNNTYTNNAKIDRHTTTNTHRGNRNSQLLKTNTQGFVDVVKRDGGNVDFDSYWNPSDIARMDVLSSDQSSLEAKINALVASGLSPEEIKKSLKNNADLKALLKDGDSKFDAIYDAQKAKVEHLNSKVDTVAGILEAGGVAVESSVGVMELRGLIKKYGLKEATKIIAKQTGQSIKDAGSSIKNALRGGKKKNYQFGTNSNQESHAWRHIENESGLSRKDVIPKIENLIETEGKNIKEPRAHNYTIRVNGKKIQVTLSRHPNGKINIGRMHEIE